MEISTREVAFEHDGVAGSGLLAWDAHRDDARPGVLVAHTIRGRTAFEEQKARDLAEQGYAALAIDLYGESTRGSGLDAMREHMNAFLSDRGRLRSRLLGWHSVLTSEPEVDAARTAAIGFCFGGLCVLDLARADAGLDGVASFHGLLAPPPKAMGGATATSTRVLVLHGFHGLLAPPAKAMGGATSTRVLVLHGWDDPLAPPDDVLALAAELTALGADWQLHAYGSTMHAFTNPAAGDSVAGTVYNPAADRRSHAAMQAFLAELFSD